MNIVQFIDKATSSDLFSNNVLLHFKGSGPYPLLFFSLLIKRLKSISKIPIGAISLETDGIETAKAKLETSFLGQKFVYWLHDINVVKGKKRSKLIDYIQQYNGPNLLAFFSDDSVDLQKNNVIIVNLEESINATVFLKLVTFLGQPESKSLKIFCKQLFDKHYRLDLDKASVLISYAFLVGRRGYKDFFNKWLDQIIVPEKSLFTLSQYFFQKNQKKFFELWSTINSDYGTPFWVVFWSEQLWRASNYVQQMRNRNLGEAKRVSFRLPFSFMQRNWSDYQPQELNNAHDFIHDIDFSLKNGGSPFALDLFYSKFLNGEFS